MGKTKLYTFYMSLYGPPVKMASLHDSYVDAVFELGVHEASEIWTGLPHTFTKKGLLQLPG